MPMSQPAWQKATVLVVDDEGAIRESMVRMLALEGYRVLPAASGDEALELLNRYMPRVHLVVTDVMLQGMNGPELAARVALFSPPPAVLFISGGHSLGELPGPVLWKPFRGVELVATVGRLLHKTSFTAA